MSQAFNHYIIGVLFGAGSVASLLWSTHKSDDSSNQDTQSSLNATSSLIGSGYHGVLDNAHTLSLFSLIEEEPWLAGSSVSQVENIIQSLSIESLIDLVLKFGSESHGYTALDEIAFREAVGEKFLTLPQEFEQLLKQHRNIYAGVTKLSDIHTTIKSGLNDGDTDRAYKLLGRLSKSDSRRALELIEKFDDDTISSLMWYGVDLNSLARERISAGSGNPLEEASKLPHSLQARALKDFLLNSNHIDPGSVASWITSATRAPSSSLVASLIEGMSTTDGWKLIEEMRAGGADEGILQLVETSWSENSPIAVQAKFQEGISSEGIVRGLVGNRAVPLADRIRTLNDHLDKTGENFSGSLTSSSLSAYPMSVIYEEVARISDVAVREQVLAATAADRVSRYNGDELISWAKSLPPGSDATLQAVGLKWASLEPNSALNWAITEDSNTGRKVASYAAQQWQKTSPSDYSEWKKRLESAGYSLVFLNTN